MLTAILPPDSRHRTAELLARTGPVSFVVESRAGEEALGPLLDALDTRRRLVFRAPGLTDLENLAAFRRTVEEALGVAVEGAPDWTEVLDAVLDSGPVIVILDRPRLLAQANRQFWRAVGQSWIRARGGGVRSALIMVDDRLGLGDALGGRGSPFSAPADDLRPGPPVPPLDVVRVSPRTPWDMAEAGARWDGGDLLRAWAFFGTNPLRWPAAPDARGPEAALRALTADPHRAGESPVRLLERLVQTPHRYASMLRALSRGALPRRALSRAVDRSSTTRSASGPYLKRLEELGLVSVERPLDAPAGARRSRYRITDPYEALWWSCMHPLGARVVTEPDWDRLWADHIRPHLYGHVVSVLPIVIRAFLWRFAKARFGAPPREVGPLWGEGYDFPAAATLRSGAVCYAHIHGGRSKAGIAELRTLEAQMSEVRYGFGRQARLRLIIALTGFDDELRREAARNGLIRLLGPEELGGGSGQAGSGAAPFTG